MVCAIEWVNYSAGSERMGCTSGRKMMYAATFAAVMQMNRRYAGQEPVRKGAFHVLMGANLSTEALGP